MKERDRETSIQLLTFAGKCHWVLSCGQGQKAEQSGSVSDVKDELKMSSNWALERTFTARIHK